MRGTSARIGMHCRTTAYGKSERSIQVACAMSTAHVTPSTIAIARPVMATSVLCSSAVIRIANSPSENIAWMTWCGYGTKYGRPRWA